MSRSRSPRAARTARAQPRATATRVGVRRREPASGAKRQRHADAEVAERREALDRNTRRTPRVDRRDAQEPRAERRARRHVGAVLTTSSVHASTAFMRPLGTHASAARGSSADRRSARQKRLALTPAMARETPAPTSSARSENSPIETLELTPRIVAGDCSRSCCTPREMDAAPGRGSAADVVAKPATP